MEQKETSFFSLKAFPWKQSVSLIQMGCKSLHLYRKASKVYGQTVDLRICYSAISKLLLGGYYFCPVGVPPYPPPLCWKRQPAARSKKKEREKRKGGRKGVSVQSPIDEFIALPFI